MSAEKFFASKHPSGLKMFRKRNFDAAKSESRNLNFKFDLMGEKKFEMALNYHTLGIGAHNLFLIILNPLSVYVLFDFMLLPLYAFSDI